MSGSALADFTLQDFSGGLDLRPGLFAGKDVNRWAILQNAHPTAEKRIRRRCPIRQAAGSFGAGALGLLAIDGALYSLMPRGSALSLPTGVLPLYFDLPPGNPTMHTFVEGVMVGDTACITLAHTGAGVTRYWLHVFDGAADVPTFVTDPAWPWTHMLNPTTTPAMATGASKVWESGPDRNTYHGGVMRPRVWNTMDRPTYLNNGHEQHFYCPTAGLNTFTVYLDASKLGTTFLGDLRAENWVWTSLTQGYLAWVVEQFTGTAPAQVNGLPVYPDFTNPKNWASALTEVPTAPAAGQCSWGTTPNTSVGATYANWLTVTINAAAPGWYRTRVLPSRDGITQQANNYVVSGLLNPTQGSSVIQNFQGDGVTIMWQFDPASNRAMGYADPLKITYTLVVNGVAAVYGTNFTLTNNNGYVQLNITSGPPPDGSLCTFSQITYTDDANKWLWVPPGVVQTLSAAGVAQQQYAGGLVQITNVLGLHALFLNFDPTSGKPTTLTVIPPPDTTGNLGFIGGKQLSNSVWLGNLWRDGFGNGLFLLPVYNGAVFTTPNLQSIVYLYRNLTVDLASYNLVGTLFGASDAGWIASAHDDNSGGQIRALATTRNRMLVLFDRGAQLWSISVDPSLDKIVDTGPVGCDTQATPHAVDFYGSVIVPTTAGIRAFSLGIQLADTLDDSNIGTAVDGLGSFQVLTAGFWPKLSHYIAAVTINGQFSMLGLSYHERDKVSGWFQITAAGLTGVDYRTMIAIEDRLYFRSGTKLYYFDGSAVLGQAGWRDDNDAAGAGNAYPVVAAPHLNPLGRPQLSKRYRRLEVIQTGKATIGFRTLSMGKLVTVPGPVLTGSTVGMPRCALAMRSVAMAPQFTSTDETGWELELYGYDFALEGR